MSCASAAVLQQALQAQRLLEPAQLDELAGELLPRFPDTRALAREVVRRGWLTPWQANQLVLGRGPALRLGPYTLLDKLGEGGMGQVYKARHEKLGRLVALKVIRPEWLAHPEAVHRFRREARAAAQLHHPNVVLVYDADEVDGTHFFAMEYVEGTDLARLVHEGGPLPVGRACDCVRQAALGLQHAHERGLVHRDIKPANLFLTTHQIKVLDLGLARLSLCDGPSGSITEEGVLMGTLDYLAPEQAKDAHAVDIRADLYSLGCTFYHLLTGRPPFADCPSVEKLFKHQWAEPAAVEALRPEVPPRVAAVVRRLMAKRPEDRYQTPAEAAAALHALDSPPVAVPVPQPPHSPEAAASTVSHNPLADLMRETTEQRAVQPRRGWRASRRALLYGTGGLLSLGLGLLLLAVLLHKGEEAGKPGPPDSPQPCPASLDDLDGTQIPAGEHFAWQPAELVQVLGEHRLRHWERVHCVAFSPDGNALATGGGDCVVRLWDASTGTELAVLSPAYHAEVTGVAWAADGKTLVAIQAGGVHVLSTWDLADWQAGGKLLRAARTIPTGHKGDIATLALSGDGKILATGGPYGPWTPTGEVHLWDMKTLKELHPDLSMGHVRPIAGLAFSPNGRTVAAVDWGGTIKLWDVATGRERAAFNAGTKIHCVAFIDETTLALGDADDKIRLWDVTPGREEKELPTRVEGHFAPLEGLAVDRERKLLASASRDRTVKLWDLAAWRATGVVTLVRTFEGQPGWVMSVAFSPDGRTVASGGESAVILWDANTGKERIPLAWQRSYNWAGSLACAPDNRHLALANADGTTRLWDMLTGRERWALKSFGAPLALAPDGHTLAATTYGQGVRLAEIALDQEPPAVRELPALPFPGRWLAFSADGRTLYTASGTLPESDPQAIEVARWDVATGKETSLRWRHPPAGPLTLCPAAGKVAWVTGPGKVQVWDLETGKKAADLETATKSSWSLSFSPDGRLLAHGGFQDVVVWNVADGKERASYRASESQLVGQVVAVAWSPDGRLLASAGVDRRVIVWDVLANRKLHAWQFPGRAGALAFTPDSRHLATANWNGTVYVLRVR